MAKNNSEMKSIRKKLVAAIAMVMVASIMVVSSSYAWFTLSTAPEIKGIQTSVGANGNLEMALRTIYDVNNITNTTSGGTFPAANSFWGNLVDVSDDDTYKMSEIKLAPARLNLVGGKINVGSAYLKTAVYGTDGRVSGLEANTFTGTYSPTAGGFSAGTDYGVRGVGTKSGMSAAELALRNARNVVNTAKGEVQFQAETSLSEDSVKLANILIYHELNENQAYTADDRTNVVNAIARLQSIVNSLDNALKATVVPVAVVKGLTVTTSDITVTTSAITVAGLDDADWTELGLDGLKSAILAAKADLEEIQGMIDDATDALPTEADSYTFDQLSAPLAYLLSTADIAVEKEGVVKTFGEYTNKIEMGLDLLIPGSSLRLVNGIYYNIGEFIGDYEKGANIVLQGNFGEGLNFEEPRNVPVTMKVRPTAPVNGAFYLAYFINQLSSLKAEGGDDTGLITDLYAYALDLAFRTNAADSNLLLQTAGVSRVDGNDHADVQGAGSYMQFTVASTGYTVEQLKELMGAIRVVFFNYEDGSIFGIAALDLVNGVVETTDTVKANLVMYNYSTEGDMLTLQTAKADDEAVITALTQNQAKGISALVYLDGDLVENGDVGISGETASGTMNLQFASSAELDPMDYTFADQNP